LGTALEEKENHISQMFYYTIRDVINGKNREKKVSGLINVPKKEGIYSVIVMLRGFVPMETYATGTGTKRAGEVFAQNNFITLAPDFLGYGVSDNPSQNSMEERFQTYTTALTLLSSLENLNSGLEASYSGRIKADSAKVGIWGHSNGGQIALSVLEITGKNYPTVLWAPVSKPFPYSILYFTDEFDDHGKALRKIVANFEKDYDIEQYSASNFYSWINAPIEIHQGIADNAVALKWSDQLVSDLKKLEKDVMYFTYPQADHNLSPGWDEAVERSLNFYRKYLQM
ncbi:MAG: Peptidase, partial [Candidatus Levybacteria bacterium GW2011_GWC2_37_7]